jgi:CubicO group peptidase (beta-lactamase class C family)
MLSASAALAAVAWSPPATSALPRTRGADNIDDFIAAAMEQYNIPGLSLAIVKAGRVAKTASYGMNDTEFGIAATDATVYQLASVSKIFTSVGVMLLAARGQLDVDAPVSDYIKEAPRTWSSIRIHHLLEHTSGLPGSLDQIPEFAAQERERREREKFVDAAKLDYFTNAERLAYIVRLQPQTAAGVKWSYNQIGYILTGLIIERVSGAPFESYMRERVLAPLGMTSARYGDSRVVVPGRRQVAYTRQYGPIQNWLWPYSTSDYPAAGLNMTASDVAKLFVALDGSLLPLNMRERMWEPVSAVGAHAGYAMGWTAGTVGARKAVGHEGGGCSYVTHVPSERITAIVLCNLAGSGADLSNKVMSLLLNSTAR